MSSPKSASRILTEPGNLQPLLERAHYLQSLTRILQGSVDPILGEHINLSNLRDDTAIITADTPAWLSNIRYLAPTFLRLLRQQPGLENLHKIQLKVQPTNIADQTGHDTRRATLSAESAEVLKSAAEGVQDSGLAHSLRRLSARAGQNPPKKA